MIEQFDCRETEQYMNDFVNGTIVGDDMWYFLNHVLNCPACYEELETRYLLAEALVRVENGESINLKKEIEEKIRIARHVLKMHRLIRTIFRTFQVVSMVGVAFAVVNIFVNLL